MRLSSFTKTKSVIMSVLILATFFTVMPTASLNTNSKHAFLPLNNTKQANRVAQNLLIKQRNPVVNEGNLITLTAIDNNSKPVKDIVWSSGSPDIAKVNPQTGEVTGVKQGFATITAQGSGESISTFVVVTKVRKGKGERVPGDSKIDNAGKLYITNPSQNVILVTDKSLNAPLQPFAGERSSRGGNQNGFRDQARFAGPTAIAIDNNPKGGLYVTDTLNHQIRKIDFNGQVETLLGTGFPGKSTFDSDGILLGTNPILSSPRGIVSDSGGNLYVADTDNHSIYYVDFARSKVSLLAGQPGVSGQDDGSGKDAKFKRPSGLALSSDGRLLTVADEDNNRVRLLEITRQADGRPVASVSTLGTNSVIKKSSVATQNQGTAITFDKPQSVSIDGLNNIYVVDSSGVQVVSHSNDGTLNVTQLAQPGVSFNKAVNVVVKGTEAFVLDAEANSEDEAVNVVTVGGPEIKAVTPSIFRMEGGADVVVIGSNFAPETIVTFGDVVVKAEVISATELRFKVPPQPLPGVTTFSVLTRGGIAQRELSVVSKPVSELAIGEITTIAGGLAFSGDGGSALESNLGISTKVALDSLGNVFIADVVAGRVRRVDAETGVINTIAGGGTSLDDKVIATISKIQPNAIAVDTDGNIFVSDDLTQSIRRIDAMTNTITTIAGKSDRAFGGDGGLAIDAGFGDTPHTLLFDRSGNLFVSTNNRVRRIDGKTGIISTVVGTGTQGFSGDGGPADKARLAIPSGLAFDSKGNLFIADAFNGRVRRVDAQTNIITTVAGNGDFAGGSDRDGKPATSIGLVGPSAVAIDSSDNLIVSDSLLSRVDLSTGIINLVKQKPPSLGCSFEAFDFLTTTPGTTIALDGSANLFVSDLRRIRKINLTTGVVSNIAGKKLLDVRGDNNLATTATLGAAIDITNDPQGNIFITDFDSSVIRRIDAKTGVISRFAGIGKTDCNFTSGGAGPDGGNALATNFLQPLAITTDKQGNLYLADFSDGKVRKVDAQTTVVSTVAGNGSLENQISGDGGLAIKAGLGNPRDIIFDPQGNLIIASEDYIRKVDARTNIITTIAGNGSRTPMPGKNGDVATKVSVSPVSITTDSRGNIFIAENGSIVNGTVKGGSVRRVDISNGTISTVAGNGGTRFSGEGGLATNAGLGFVRSVQVDVDGNLFISAAEYDQMNFLGFLSTKVFKVDANSKTISTFIKGNNVYQGDGGQVSNASVIGIPVMTFVPSGDLLLLDLKLPVAGLRQVHLAKTSGGPVSTTISITNAAYLKPTLSIDGQGFGSSAAKVTINGADISGFITSNADSKLTLTGTRKKLNMRKGANQLTVTNSNGATANFQFNFPTK